MGIGAAIAGSFSALTVPAVTGSAAVLTTTGQLVAAVINASIAVGINAASNKLFAPKSPNQKSGRSGNLRSSVMAHQVVLGEVRKGGLIAYVNGSGAAGNNKWLYLAVIVAAHEVQSMDKLFVGGTETDFDAAPPEEGNAIGRLRDYANFKYHTGSPTQSADALLVSENTNWTAAHQLKGRAYVRAELRESPKRYPAFIPALTIQMKGAKTIYDPRSGGTTGYSANNALQVAWILETYLKIPRARIHAATLITAADSCDEQVQIKDLTFVNRYESHGFFDLEGQPENWLEPIVRAMAGAVIEHDGTYYIHAGAYTAPVITITDDDIIGNITLATARSNLERANTIKGIFVSPETHDAPAEYVPVTEATFLTEDNNVENILELDLEFCATHEQARRVASIALRTERMDETLELEVNLLKGLDVKPWDVVTIDSSVIGITQTFRILDHQFITDPSGPRAFVRLTLREIASTIYDWDPATQEKALQFQTPISPDEPVETTPSVILADGTPAAADEQIGSIHINADPRGPLQIFKKVES